MLQFSLQLFCLKYIVAYFLKARTVELEKYRQGKQSNPGRRTGTSAYNNIDPDAEWLNS
jgi:hypothetical protein